MPHKVRSRSLFLSPFQGRIAAAYDCPEFLQAVFDCRELLDAPECAILLDGRNRVGVVNLLLPDGRREDFVVKEFRSSGLARLKTLLGPSKALKSWRGSLALVERGIETPDPAAYLEKRKRGLVEQSFFLAGHIRETIEIRRLFQGLPEVALRPLLQRLARFLAACHEKGIFHRDLSDGNILVKRNEKGDFLFYLVDTNRIRIRPKAGLPSRLRNLVRLGVPRRLQAFFLRHYMRYSGFRKLWGWYFIWYKVNKQIYWGFVRIKKKLRLRRLAQKLRVQ